MRYRKLDANDDYSFGNQQNDFYIDVPEAPAQAVKTRLSLTLGEWFLDTTDGTDWYNKILGAHTGPTRDLEIQQRTLGTQGVLQINNYNSTFDPNARAFGASFQLDTEYGELAFSEPSLFDSASLVSPGLPSKPTVLISSISLHSAILTWS